MSQLDHIANRIAWRARKNAVWTRNTRLWKFAEDSLKERVGAELEHPVFFSVANEEEGVVFGAEALLALSGGKSQSVPYRDLLGACCPEVGIAAPSDKEFMLSLNVRSRGTVHAKVEGGAAGYGVWRVLQMILKMGGAWFEPEPEGGEEAEEATAGEQAEVGEDQSDPGQEATEGDAEQGGTDHEVAAGEAAATGDETGESEPADAAEEPGPDVAAENAPSETGEEAAESKTTAETGD